MRRRSRPKGRWVRRWIQQRRSHAHTQLSRTRARWGGRAMGTHSTDACMLRAPISLMRAAAHASLFRSTASPHVSPLCSLCSNAEDDWIERFSRLELGQAGCRCIRSEVGATGLTRTRS